MAAGQGRGKKGRVQLVPPPASTARLGTRGQKLPRVSFLQAPSLLTYPPLSSSSSCPLILRLRHPNFLHGLPA